MWVGTALSPCIYIHCVCVLLLLLLGVRGKGKLPQHLQCFNLKPLLPGVTVLLLMSMVWHDLLTSHVSTTSFNRQEKEGEKENVDILFRIRFEVGAVTN